MILIFFTFAGAAIAVLVALLSLIKNPQSAVHRWLAAFIVSSCAWIVIGNIQVILPPEMILLALRLTFVASVAVGFAMLYFSRAICGISTSFRYRLINLLLLSLGIALSLSDLVINGVLDINPDSLRPSRGIGYPIVTGIILYFVLQALYVIEKTRRKNRGDKKAQLNIIMIGLSAGTLSAIITNIVLPNITGSTFTSRFAFLAVVIWTVLLMYAVVQHHFLDIRLAIVRALGYVAALSSIVILYIIFVVLAASTIFLDISRVRNPVQIYDIAVAIFVALTFQPFRKFFDKLTRAIFYRDSYDFQKVLDKITSSFVNSVDLEKLSTNTLSRLIETVKSEFATIVILPSESFKHERAITVGNAENDGRKLAKVLSKHREPIILENIINDLNPRLSQEFYDSNTVISVRLRASGNNIGYIFLGHKSTGSVYATQDIDLIHIVADGLAVAIQNALRFEEIRDFNRTLQTKVDQATAQLRRTNAKLKQLDEAKDEFISMASHQLRTPLTSVKGYLSMVLEGDAGDLQGGQKKLLEEAYAGAQRMVYLIADFLNVSRLKTGKFVLEYSNVNLAHLINEEIGQLQATAGTRQLKLKYEAPEVLPMARLDENKIRQVVMNLIDNAIYYSKPNGVVKVELFADDGHVVFRVKDSGIGVPANEQKNLFEKFFRASNARKVRPDGTGIGLFMIKKVILAHGGSVIFHSTQDKGSTFGFSLPIKAKPKSSELQAESIQQSAKLPE